MKGSRIWCSRCTTRMRFSFSTQLSSAAPSPPPACENQSVKMFRSSNTFGRSRFSSAHSSCRSFCSGVPAAGGRAFLGQNKGRAMLSSGAVFYLTFSTKLREHERRRESDKRPC